MKKILFILFISFLFISSISARSFTPFGDIDLRDNLDILNGRNITAQYYCNATSCHEISEFLASGSGDITSVTAGTGLIGGGITGDVILNASADSCGINEVSKYNGTHFNCVTDATGGAGSDVPIWLNNSNEVFLNSSFPQNVNFTGNLTLGDRIIFRLGEVIDNLVNGWITITGSLQVSNDLNVTNNITADTYFGDGQNLNLAKINSPIWKTIQDMSNLFHSSGVFSENFSVSFIKLNSDNTFNVTSGSGTIRATNNATDTLLFFDWGESNNIAISLNEVIYVGIEYNAGSPQVVTKSTNTWDSQTDFVLGSVIRDVSGVHLQREDHAVGDHANNMILRLFGTSPFSRDERTGGLIIGTSGRNITMTSGIIWEKLNQFIINSIDTSGSDTFDRYYRNGSNGWFVQTSQTTWNNTHYDDGTGTLNALGNNKYSVEWIYLETDSEIVTMYGREEFNSVGEAEASSPPSNAPDRITIHSKLIGRIIFQKDGTSAIATESVFVTVFTVAGITDVNNLANIDTDFATQYLLTDGTRAITGNLTINGNYISNGTAIFSLQDLNNTGTGGDFSFSDFQGSFDLNISDVESSLNTNSSDYWDNMNTINTTQMQDNGGVLNILESWFSSLFDTLFGTKTTNDLTEGTTNLYQNKTFNQSLTDTLYADISLVGDNSSWNQSFADTLYSTGSHTVIWDSTFNTTFDDRDADTTYTNGTGILLDGTQFNSTLGIAIEKGELVDSGTLGFDWDDSEVADTLSIIGGILGANSVSGLFTTTGLWTLGDGGDRIDVNSDTWDVTNGVMTGLSMVVSQLTAGTFGTGSYVMDTNLTVETLLFETDPSNHFINDNSTCIIIQGSTSVFEVC